MFAVEGSEKLRKEAMEASVRMRIAMVVEKAAKVAARSRRTHVTTEDVSRAVQMLGLSVRESSTHPSFQHSTPLIL